VPFGILRFWGRRLAMPILGTMWFDSTAPGFLNTPYMGRRAKTTADELRAFFNNPEIKGFPDIAKRTGRSASSLRGSAAFYGLQNPWEPNHRLPDEVVVQSYAENKGNISAMSRELGRSRTTLYPHLRALKLI
jgi:DNA-binding NtrC family response regulator